MRTYEELQDIYRSFDLSEFNKVYAEEYKIYKSLYNVTKTEMEKYSVVMENLKNYIQDEVADVVENLKVYIYDDVEMEYNGFGYNKHNKFYVEFIEPYTEHILEYNTPRKTKIICINEWRDSDKLDECVYTMMDEYIRVDEICSKIYSELINKKHNIFIPKFNEMLSKVSKNLYFDDFHSSNFYILIWVDSGLKDEVSQGYKWIYKIK
jgi:6-pyruvoyl-tetrahydropterin synthase